MFIDVIFGFVVTALIAIVSLAFFAYIFPGPVGFKTTNVWIGMITSYVFWFMCGMTMWSIDALEAGQVTYNPISPNGYKWAFQIIVYVLVYLYVDKSIRGGDNEKVKQGESQGS